MIKIVRIPLDRVGVLIGRKGEVKSFIEQATGVVVDVDSESGEVTINEEKAKNPLFGLKVIDIIKAIGRGFSPEKAYELLSDDRYLHIIDIHDYVGKNKKHMRRIKARIIGKTGRTRKTIEQLTGASISIFGGTVSILGDLNGFETARVAVDMILSGSEHSMVYRFLERKRREMRMATLDSIIMAGSSEEGDEDSEEETSDDGEE